MKNIRTLLLIAGTTMALSVGVSAAEPLLSPRAQANRIVTVTGGRTDSDLIRSDNALGVAAKAKASGVHSTVSGSASGKADAVALQPNRVGSPKGLQQLRESGREFQVAPLK